MSNSSGTQSLILGTTVSFLVIITMFLLNKLRGKKKEDDNVLLKNPDTKYEVALIEKENITKDTRRFRFALENAEQRLGLPVGQHVHLVENLNENLVIRAYTPTTSDDTKGYFELVIKVYFANSHPKFPDGGKMTQHLESLKIGDKIKVKGPSGKIQYKGKGKFEIKQDKKSDPAKEYHFEKLGLIAGGSGVTPMYQLMQAITSDPEDKTEVHLLFANQSEEDILLRKEIEQMAEQHPNQIKFWYTIDRSTPEWTYSTGFIDAPMIEQHLPGPSEKTGIFFCGPPPMNQYAVKPNLEKLGYSQENQFKY